MYGWVYQLQSLNSAGDGDDGENKYDAVDPFRRIL